MTAVPLRRNRDFMLLQIGQLLSNAGTQLTAIAYPLLVLALTGSAAKAGVVAFARTLPLAVLALPSGLAADRWSRRRLMIGADGVRVVAVGSLGAAILLGEIAFWPIAVVAFVEGAGAAVFAAAHAGAVRAAVPLRQLPAAAGAQTGRQAAVTLAGPPLGGALFGVSRALPFLVDAVLLRVLDRLVARDADAVPGGARARPGPAALTARRGVPLSGSRPFLRTCAFLYGLGNFIGPGLLLAVVVIGNRQGLTGGQVGALVAAFGACLLLGSFVSPLVRRVLPVRGVLLLELWTWLGCAAFLVRPDVYVLVAGILPTALAIPSTDSVVNGYRLALTPDRLLGRVESVRTTIALLIAPFGPLAAGLLLGPVSARATIAVFAAVALALALWGTLSPSIRAAPSLAELEGRLSGP